MELRGRGGWWFCPLGGDGAGVELAFVSVGLEVGLEEGVVVDAVIGCAGVVARVTSYYCGGLENKKRDVSVGIRRTV